MEENNQIITLVNCGGVKNKFFENNSYDSVNNDQFMIDDEENMMESNDESANNCESNAEVIYGDSGFDQLPSENHFEEGIGSIPKLFANNSVYRTLFSDESASRASDSKNEEKRDVQEQDIVDFFNGVSSKKVKAK
jgi:hypothetical protein